MNGRKLLVIAFAIAFGAGCLASTPPGEEEGRRRDPSTRGKADVDAASCPDAYRGDGHYCDCQCHRVWDEPDPDCEDEDLPTWGMCEDEEDMCFGAWVDETGQCRGPTDGTFPDECCDGLDDGEEDTGDGEEEDTGSCVWAWLDETGQCRGPIDGAYPPSCCEDLWGEHTACECGTSGCAEFHVDHGPNGCFVEECSGAGPECGEGHFCVTPDCAGEDTCPGLCVPLPE